MQIKTIEDFTKTPNLEKMSLEQLIKNQQQDKKLDNYVYTAEEITENSIHYLDEIIPVANNSNDINTDEEDTFLDETLNLDMENFIDADYDFDNIVDNLFLKDAFNNAFDILSEREQIIIQLAYGIGNRRHTLKEIANSLNLTSSRIGVIKDDIERKIQEFDIFLGLSSFTNTNNNIQKYIQFLEYKIRILKRDIKNIVDEKSSRRKNISTITLQLQIQLLKERIAQLKN